MESNKVIIIDNKNANYKHVLHIYDVTIVI
jgi:hypothetical protein